MLSNIPTETFQKILQFVVLDADKLWLNTWLPLRQVSKEFRECTAQVYFDLFLAYPSRCLISFNCGFARVDGHLQGTKCEVEVEMFFHRREEDRVVFKEDMMYNLREHYGEVFAAAYERKKKKMWRRKIEEDSGVAIHVISIYGVSLDSALPGLRYDVERGEISFEWEGMLNAFILERGEVEKRYMKRCEGMFDDATRREAVLGLFGPVRGALEFARGDERVWKKAFKEVRRCRFEKAWREKYGSEISVAEMDLKVERRQVRRIVEAEREGVGSDGWKDLSGEDGEEDEEESDEENEEEDEEENGEEFGDEAGEHSEGDGNFDPDDESDDGVIHVHVPAQYIS